MIRLLNIDLFIAAGEIYLIWVLLVIILVGLVSEIRVVLRLLVLVLIVELVLQLDGCIMLRGALVFNGHWYFNKLGTLFIVLMNIIFIVIVIQSIYFVKLERRIGFELFLLMFLGFFSLVCLIRANDFVLFYLCLEWYSLCMYVLANIGRISNFGTEAGLKYYVLGALSSGFSLFGFLVCYGMTGLTIYNDYEIFMLCENGERLVVGVFFMSVGLLFKLGVAPFHVWVPDIYEGSSTLVTMYFSLLPKIGLLCVFLRLNNSVFYELHSKGFVYLCCIVLVSLLTGTIGGLFQSKMKRLMAYSSIAHGGYLLMPLILLTHFGLFGFSVYIIIYVLMVVNVFSILLCIRGITVDRVFKLIVRLGIIMKSKYYLGMGLMISVLSLAGFPPFAGFYSKVCVFISLIGSGNYSLFFCMVFFSVIGGIYYLRLVRMLCFNRERWVNMRGISSIAGYLISFFTHIIVFFSIYNIPVILLCQSEMLYGLL